MSKLRSRSKASARALVIQAAMEWVHFEDDGLVGSMQEQVRVNDQLVAAVESLEKLRRRKI